ncbi:thioesterase domain-containing protein [Aspergillus steynii IBT 23096]|uniref:Thioesterase domain-containing protein n=1 Tax=Aspergillus steynii IBT 23096 TaxID=1392250 RepID=A0A2I2FV19_9EURO|nr:thioesterase domain-containing protein [Aspergillus steynii IBT 23096]PLB44498.1 thioesterase domain-containing protein [Aspergillus steynii IBT 23096]
MENPELIQDLEWHRDGTKPRVPLFLIHDGGGTTFSYHCLDPLRRPTYGLFNPRYHSGGSFEGGVRGMGRLYAVMIKQTCLQADFPGKRNPDGSVDILLGGWSMGGLLSLEIAKVLTGDRDVRVIGVLMIESMCPAHLPTGGGYLDTLDHFDLDRTDRNLALSIRAMQEALRVIRDWDPPVWAGSQAAQRPRFSLLRAVDPLPTRTKRRHILDIYRQDRTLGWDKYDPGLFTETVDVKGNHFEMFSFQHIPGVSKAIKRCCDTLEKLGQS